jgi:hypothetical protein
MRDHMRMELTIAALTMAIQRDVDDRLERLSDLGDPLEAFRAAVDFEMFRPDLARRGACLFRWRTRWTSAIRSSDDVQGPCYII